LGNGDIRVWRYYVLGHGHTYHTFVVESLGNRGRLEIIKTKHITAGKHGDRYWTRKVSLEGNERYDEVDAI
jgi:hypothetical protein